MKTISSPLRDHLDLDVTTLATCWELIRRDGVTLRFTDHDRDLTVDGFVYQAFGGYSRSALKTDEKLSVDNVDVSGFLDAMGITEEGVRSGKYDRAEVRMFVVNWEDTTMGGVKLRRGWLGQVSTSRTGLFKSELRGMTGVFQQQLLELYGPECRADLGDHRCRVPINPSLVERNTAYAVGEYVCVETDTMALGYAKRENRIYRCTTAGTTDAMTEPTYDTGVGNTTADGTAVFTAEEAWTRDAVITEVTNRLQFRIDVDESRAVDDWFNYGSVIFESGQNEGAVCEIKDWTAATMMEDGELFLFVPASFVPQVGDRIRLYKGCNFSRESCIAFANILNFRGEPYMTGNDYVFSSADPPL